MNAVAIPVLLPLGTAALAALIAHRRVERGLLAVSAGLVLAAAAWLVARTAAGEILVLELGGWGPGVGITWVVDRLGAAMLGLSALVSLATVLYAPGALRLAERRFFFPLQQLLVFGVNGAFVTGDLFNLFVCFEVLLVASYVLISLGGRRTQLVQTVPYVLLNVLGSAVFLAGVGGVYGATGTVNLAELATRVETGAVGEAFWHPMALVLVAFALKAALAPLFFWLPDAYAEAPLAVGGFLAGLLTKVGVYALYRTVPLLASSADALGPTLIWTATATMAIGVLGALGRSSLRGILSFHIISQVGYMVLGLGLLTRAALAAAIFYVVHHVLVKAALFLAVGAVERETGVSRLGDLGGVARRRPWLAVAFLIPALALAGVPPLSGFWGKLFLVQAGLAAEAVVPAVVAVVVSLLTLASMLKVWSSVYWGEASPAVVAAAPRRLLAGPLVLVGASLLVGLLAAPVYGFADAAASDLLARDPYVAAVLGPGSP